MKTMTSKILGKLNESITNPRMNEGFDDGAVEGESTVGTEVPKKVYQCDNCAEFYVGTPTTNESVKCPFCESEGHEVGTVVNEVDNEDEPKEPLITEEEEEELRSEAEVIVKEALNTLDRNDYKKFNESYRPRVRVTNKGELEALVESSKGGFVTAKRRMTSRQKTAYGLSENYTPASRSSDSSKKLESIRMSRQVLMIKNESRAVKLQACKILERQGVKYDFQRFNKSMNEFINGRNVKAMLENISEDDEMGKSELDQMTPEQIGDQVTSVIQDTGLGIIANDVEIDGDTATVNVRVEDSDAVEVHTSEVEEVLQDVLGAPVEIVGPYPSEGDKSVSDLAVVINPDSEDELGEDICPECGSDPCVCESDGQENSLMSSEMKKNEGMRRRSKRVNEKFVKGTGDVSLFALLSNDSADNEPQFLAQDDSLISGNEDGAENLARVFVSEEAAKNYLQSAGLEDKFLPVSISIVTNESIDGEYNSGQSIDEDSEIETDDGTYFKKDGYCYKKSSDGTIEECDESEYDNAKASTYDTTGLKESYNKRMRGRRKK